MKRYFALVSLLSCLTLGIRGLDLQPAGGVAQGFRRAGGPPHRFARRAGGPPHVNAPQAKLIAELAHGQTCADVAELPSEDIAPEAEPKLNAAGKRVTVSSLIERALVDQRRLLMARKAELERWNRADQAHFATWFGTLHPEARKLVYDRIRVVTLVNKEYSAGNFRRAVAATPPGVIAYVFANDPSKIYVAKPFVFEPFFGTNCRPGTISHEMSHFELAGGTKDFTYGTQACRQLARTDPARALYNADNFEFYVEKVR
jgi:hypothetical protein